MVSLPSPSCQAAHFPHGLHSVSPYVSAGIFSELLLLGKSWPYFGWDRHREEAICWRVGSVSAYPPAERPVNRTANMAAKYFYLQGFLLILFNFISTAALEKRFSDFKRCADEECSSKFASLLFKQIGRISRMHLCTVPAVQLAINCALSLDLWPIDICDLESILYLLQVCENDAHKKVILTLIFTVGKWRVQKESVFIQVPAPAFPAGGYLELMLAANATDQPE